MCAKRPDESPAFLFAINACRARLDDWSAGGFNGAMQKIIGILCCAILLAGCASRKPSAPKTEASKPAAIKPVVTPDFRPVGKVALVDTAGQSVVITYSPGELPRADARLNIYHNGLKVAEVKVDGQWQGGNNTVADIITGNVQLGDEARQE
jgi:hypothetical protein